MKFHLYILAAMLVCAHAKFYTDCGSKLASVQSVDVNGCSVDAKECTLKRNSNVTIDVTFTPTIAVKNVESIVHGVIMNLPVPFPLPNPEGCKDSGLTCPLKANEEVTYKATLPVLKSYPKVKVDVKWELKNENEEELICILIAAKIN